jgi:phosphoglycerate dehydrogenase-like enzyme
LPAFKVVLAQGLDPEAEAKLEAAAEVIRLPDATEDALCAAVIDAQAIIARTHTPITARVLEAGPRLKVVGVAGVGVDRVDLAAAERLCISVVNRPGAATEAVAELTITLFQNLLRPVHRLAEQYRSGAFKAAREKPHGRELGELTVGILGMGRIGQAVGRIVVAGYGGRVLYNDIREVEPLPFAATAVDKPTLWREADVLSLHVPLTDETRNLIDADVLAALRPTAILVNTARGKVVVTEDLVGALEKGELAGAALDVTEPEPLPPAHPLLNRSDCLVTPHVAARTFRGLRRMYDVVDDVLAVLRDLVDPRRLAMDP